MQLKALFFALLVASAQAFLPAQAPKIPVRAVKAAPTMKFDNKAAVAAIAASPILLTASQALATEGTGEPLGYDNIALVLAQVTVAHVIAITWKQWEDTQPDTDSDFFGEYDERRA